MPSTPGDEIMQGAPADIGSLSPIVQLIKLIMGGGVPQQQQTPPSPWARGGAPTDPGGSALKGAMVGGAQGLVDPNTQDQGLQQWFKRHGF